MCGRTGMSWRRRSTPGSRTGSRGGDDRVCLRRGEGLRSFQGGRETWKTASWQPAGSRIRLPLKESDIPVAVNPKSADGPSNNPQCGFWDSQFSAAQVKSVEQPCDPGCVKIPKAPNDRHKMTSLCHLLQFFAIGVYAIIRRDL